MQSEIFNGHILDQIPCLISYMDKNLNYLYVNAAYERWFGVSSEFCLKSNMVDVVGEEPLKAVKPYLQKALEGVEQNFEREVLYKNIGKKYISVNYIPDVNKDGMVEGIIIIMNDYSKIRQVQVEANSQLDIMFQTMAEGVMLLNEQGEVLQWNNAVQDLFELTENEFKGRHLKNIHLNNIYENGSPMPAKERPFQVASGTGQPVKNFKMGIFPKSGKLKWIQVNATTFSKLESYNNLPVLKKYILITMTEITELVNMKLDIAAQKTQLQNLVDGIPAFISHWDSNLINILANKKYSDLFGLSVDEIKGKHYKDVVGKIYINIQEKLQDTLQGRESTFELHRVLENKQEQYSQVTLQPEWKDGKVVGLFTVVMDMTKLRLLELKMEEQRAINIQNAKLASLGEMSAGIAHEINNPLSIISANLGLLKKHRNDEEKFNAKILVLEKSVERISKIVSGLKKFSRASVSTELKPKNLADIIHECIFLVEGKSKKHHVPVEVNLETRGRINCDEIEMEQVLINLLNNAIDAVAELSEKWVKVHLFEQGEKFILHVIDSGNGISTEVEEKMFHPFFTTKPVGQGTGLGLSIVRGIIENHGAVIHMNRALKNTCFELEFPKYSVIE